MEEEQLCVETTDLPAIPILPAIANPAESEAESATDVPLQSPVLPQKEADTVSSSPCAMFSRCSDMCEFERLWMGSSQARKQRET